MTTTPGPCQAMRTLLINDLRKHGVALGDDFNFADYLERCAGQMLDELCMMTLPCWGVVSAIFLWQSVTAIGFEMGHDANWQEFAFCVFALIVSISFEVYAFVTLTKVNSNRPSDLDSATADSNPGSGSNAGTAGAAKVPETPDDTEESPPTAAGFNVELQIIRGFQAVTFFLCFSAAKAVCAPKSYHPTMAPGDDTVDLAVYYVLILSIWTAHCLWFFPRSVIAVTVVYALPPYIDEVNLRDARIVAGLLPINDDHDTHACGDAKRNPHSQSTEREEQCENSEVQMAEMLKHNKHVVVEV